MDIVFGEGLVLFLISHGGREEEVIEASFLMNLISFIETPSI